MVKQVDTPIFLTAVLYTLLVISDSRTIVCTYVSGPGLATPRANLQVSLGKLVTIKRCLFNVTVLDKKEMGRGGGIGPCDEHCD